MKLAALASVIVVAGSIAVIACDGNDSTGTTSGTSSSGGSSSGGSSSGGSSSGGSSSGGSSGNATEQAGSPGQEDNYCKAQASHETCNGGTATEACREDAKCIYGRLMSKTAADAYFACYSAPSCKGDDNCAAEAGKAAGGAAADTYSNDCVAKLNACPDAKSLMEFCAPTVFAYPAVRDAAQACLAKGCTDLEACFKASVKPISDCK